MKKIILSLSILVLVITLTGCGCKKQEKKKVEQKAVSDEPTEVFQFFDSSLVLENGKTKISATVLNNSSKTEELKDVKITANDTNGKFIADLTISVNENIEAGSKKTIEGYYDKDITAAGSLQFEVMR